jgi:hypothetical protein
LAGVPCLSASRIVATTRQIPTGYANRRTLWHGHGQALTLAIARVSTDVSIRRGENGRVVDHYFGGATVQRRQTLMWALAARTQLDRWEPLVFEYLQSNGQGKMSSDRIWQGEVEHHFALVAFDHMLEALRIWEAPIRLPDLVVKETAEVRDLLTHWVDNMPVFNQRPRPRDPGYPTGKSFAARNPKNGPYCWWAWNYRHGAMLTPNVAASDAREAIHEVQLAVLLDDPDLARFVPPEVTTPG